jgi:hypothetical protein
LVPQFDCPIYKGIFTEMIIREKERPDFVKMVYAIALTHCDKEVQREHALGYLNALPGALDV